MTSFFYRAMHTVQSTVYCCRNSYASVRLSVTMRYSDCVGWVTLKVTTELISSGSSLLEPQHRRSSKKETLFKCIIVGACRISVKLKNKCVNAYNLISEEKRVNVSLATCWIRFIDRSLQHVAQ